MKFSGVQKTFKELFESHHLYTLCVERNYKQAINNLEAAGRISANPLAAKRIRGGKVICGPNVILTFPTARAT